MMLLMLSGKARVGKTTSAQLISEHAYKKGYSPVLLSFATVLKEEVTKNTQWTKENNPSEFRIACQKLGADRRKEDPNYWVKALQKRLKEIKVADAASLESDPQVWHEKMVIVDDCRYMNEVIFGRKVGACQIFVSHGSRKLEDHNGEWRQHESETMANSTEEAGKSQDLFHFLLSNDTTKTELKKKLNQMFPSFIDFLQCDGPYLCPCPKCEQARVNKNNFTDGL